MASAILRSLAEARATPAPRTASRTDEAKMREDRTAARSSIPAGRSVFALAAWLALCFSAATSAFFVTTEGWYETLQKPAWNPPAWVFGPAWTLLYVMMAVAAWRVWRVGGWRAQRGALVLFVVQWALNALWTPLFFGLHRPDIAFAEIVALWCVLALTVRAFWRVERLAGALLLPYWAWVTFAAALNFTLWQLNRGSA